MAAGAETLPTPRLLFQSYFGRPTFSLELPSRSWLRACLR